MIDRESGDISNWKRVNRRFLNTLRKQFLIWRTLKQAERERYLMQDDTPSRPAANRGSAAGHGGVDEAFATYLCGGLRAPHRGARRQPG